MASTEERAGRNEAVFRRVNEEAEALQRRFGELQHGEFLCECSNDGCVERLEVPMSVYENARADGRQFILRPGHERPDVERVLARSAEYVIVEKIGVAADVAERTDPRN